MVWTALLVLALVLAALGDAGWGFTLQPEAAGPRAAVLLLLLALACEFVDATLGMGYGTTITPLLLILGYPIGVIVPCAVLSQLAGNAAAAFFHHRAGNVDFVRDRPALHAALGLGGLGLAAAVAAVHVAAALPARSADFAATAMVLAVGVFLLLGSRLPVTFRGSQIAILGALAGFAKAFTGGGYGPLVCGGQILAGLPPRAAVAITALAEAIVCLATVATYLWLGHDIPRAVLLPLTAGSVLSAPLSAVVLRRIPQAVARRLIGLAVLALATLALLRLAITG